MITLEELEAAHPEIEWTTPVKVWSSGAQAWRYICRVCLHLLANSALSIGEGEATLGGQIFYPDPQGVTLHIANTHAEK